MSATTAIGSCPFRILSDCIAQLNATAQAAIHFRYVAQMTIEQIAAHLGLTWEQTDALIESSLKTLKDLLLEAITGLKTPVAA